MLSTLGLLAVGATLAIHVEEVGEVPPELSAALISALATAIERHTGGPVVVDEDRGGCLAGQPCAAAIRSRTSADALALVRLIGGPIRVRVLLEHLPGALGARVTRGEVDVPRAGGDVTAAVRALVASTLPARAVEPPPPAIAAVAPIRERGVPWVAITLLGVGAASAASGVAFGVASEAEVDELRRGGAPEDSRASAHASVAHVLWVVAAGTLSAGAAAWLLD